jgi:hypothetical protein
MITDRISLNIIFKYLDQFQQNEGPVSRIRLARREHFRITEKCTDVEDLDVLSAFINKYAPMVAFKDEDCSVMGLYELKSFNVYKNGTINNLIYLDNGQFVTKSLNINKASVENLNLNYFKQILEVKSVFDEILINEYILIQEEYIDCGYIEIHFQDAMDRLKELYNKYK